MKKIEDVEGKRKERKVKKNDAMEKEKEKENESFVPVLQ